MADKKEEKKRPAAKTAAAKKAKRGTEARDTTKALRGQKSGPSRRTEPVKRAVARPVKRVAPAAERPRAETPAAPAAPKPKAEPRPVPSAPAGELPYIGADGTVGSLPTPAGFADATQRTGVLYQAVAIAASNARQGTHATKNRARVAGGGAKPWRQKGTGRARQGSTRAPHWRHGGVVFGPNGRRYKRRIPEKMRREAFAEALAARHGAGRVIVYEAMAFEAERPRTRTVVEWLGKVGDTGKTIFVTPEIDQVTARATANERRTSFRSVGALRTTDLLTHDTVIVRRDALDALAARVAAGGAK